jgi:hypothetical protein
MIFGAKLSALLNPASKKQDVRADHARRLKKAHVTIAAQLRERDALEKQVIAAEAQHAELERMHAEAEAEHDRLVLEYLLRAEAQRRKQADEARETFDSR